MSHFFAYYQEMASVTCQTCGQNQPAATLAPASTPAPLSTRFSVSETRDFNNGEDNAVTNNPAPNPIVTISIANLQTIQQRIADLEVAQHKPRRHR